MLIGTYSSIALAVPMLLYLKVRGANLATADDSDDGEEAGGEKAGGEKAGGEKAGVGAPSAS